jgi:hypothetical protein
MHALGWVSLQGCGTSPSEKVALFLVFAPEHQVGMHKVLMQWVAGLKICVGWFKPTVTAGLLPRTRRVWGAPSGLESVGGLSKCPNMLLLTLKGLLLTYHFIKLKKH